MAIDDNTSYELTGAQIKDLTSKIKSKADSSSLAPVATSGSYNDLSDKPTIATVNNGALTIQQNGTTLDTFTANSSDNKTVNIQTITAETVAPAEEVGAITTNMIADGAVTASKIDFSQFYHAAPDISSKISVPKNTETRIQELTLPAGTWLILWGIRFTAQTSTSGTTYAILKDDSGSLQSCAVNEITDGSYVRQAVSGTHQITLTSDKTIYTTLATAADNAAVGPMSPTYLRAIRVG